MQSPARQHYARVAAAQAAGTANPGRPQNGQQYEIHAATLWEARRTLKGIKSTEQKIAKKRELLPEFDSYVAGVLEAGNGAQDDVLMTVMIWRLDIGDIEGALAIGEYAMRHSLDAPDRFERDTPSILVEQLAEEAMRQLEASHADTDEGRQAAANAAADLTMHLSRVEALTSDADMHDPIRAKLHKALGYAYRARGGHVADAIEHLKRALELNDRAGVKKDIEKLERELKQQNAGQGTAQNSSAPA